MEIKSIEDGDNIIFQATQNLWYQVVKNEEEQTKMAMVDYARKNNAELRLLDEDKVKTIIDLGCKQFLKNYNSGYISKDKIKYYYKKICASVNHFQSKNDNNIVLRIKEYLEELLEENKSNENNI